MRFWFQAPFLLRVVIVNLKDDPTTSIRGVCWQSRGAWLVFRDCQLLRSASEPAPVDGEVIVHQSNVAFLQVP
jgi:hypothetical protein